MLGEEEFQLCPNCKVGRLRPTGLAATSSDPQTNRVTNDLGYKCDSCGYTEGGQAKVVAANEQAAISESTNTTTTTSSPAATTAAVQSAVEAVGAAAATRTPLNKDVFIFSFFCSISAPKAIISRHVPVTRTLR